MKKWNQLLVRHGWLLAEVKENMFDCGKETELNIEFLLECLDTANVNYTFHNGKLALPKASPAEEEWLEAVNFKYRGRGEGLWFRPGVDEPKVQELDIFISGIVRQLNRLGFHTSGSCDGHGRRAAHVLLTEQCNMEALAGVLHAVGQKRLFRRRSQNVTYRMNLPLKQTELLDLAEQLSLIEDGWVEKGHDFIKEQLFRHSLEELLAIPGESGREEKVRRYVIEKLSPFVDYLTVDHVGNILAERSYRGGRGPTILLNSHLDTVCEIEKDREILKEGPLWSSSKGILGADDRAGVAVLLHVAEHLHSTDSFSGKVKFIFSVEEECGLVGASNVHEYFLWGTDAAIVIDRRGKGDIVTSCGGYIDFCHPSYGAFFEEVAEEAGLGEWAVTSGGSSDTKIWAGHGIQSVNLSAGYHNEHTDREVLDVEACYETAKLVKAFFGKRRELNRVLTGIRREERVMSLFGE
ncbi:M20/M25/M40 family metallo-hydrolase [Virgibacillus sediminis]|uniref:M20/M25/M40 family metallo-hydrolase n=1 Tax=Virgibacillus sediminis TaxID=202260 RepID=A0ABV7A4L2_9BACI